MLYGAMNEFMKSQIELYLEGDLVHALHALSLGGSAVAGTFALRAKSVQ